MKSKQCNKHWENKNFVIHILYIYEKLFKRNGVKMVLENKFKLGNKICDIAEVAHLKRFF